ncbi:MAG TPA: hypothetical protein DEF21_02770 [Thalassospira lucentensis]|uniref:Uncharacterized protein n=1 Tax=Thalassospira lucentensis TaxID=168935 RepID=A0A358HNR3_9PROT|nr:hypothetical protein [Thalassospira lucentensis]
MVRISTWLVKPSALITHKKTGPHMQARFFMWFIFNAALENSSPARAEILLPTTPPHQLANAN